MVSSLLLFFHYSHIYYLQKAAQFFMEWMDYFPYAHFGEESGVRMKEDHAALFEV